ncbi:hypothetical protein EPUL_004774 [Erysiphe pulchra]|uniref:ATP-dependent DNA helicase n=1 Tax=Erysiphe pulchra TaxID=225359 RepID=A0A2S4PKJ9_9PEZI|nr:hypothetical protein EPUL_004774 [Erysiphe pulchra]
MYISGKTHPSRWNPDHIATKLLPKAGIVQSMPTDRYRLFDHCIKSKIMSQDPRYNGREHIISRITLSTSDDLLFTLTRKQLPIRPCYAMTINKSQRQTLQSVGIDLTTPVLSHGK